MFSAVGVLYPQPAQVSGTYITSQVTTVTSGATTVAGYVPSSGVGQIQLVTFDVYGGDVRVFWEGSTPTSTSGHVLPGGTAYTWAANQYNNSKFILDASASSAVITASPFNGG